MYSYPYGDNQQINLNWIISEIIALHKRLDPDYTVPSFTQIYPFSDTQQLNLDWILTELKALKELAPPAPTLSSDDVLNDSTVSGDTVTDALDALLSAIGNLDSDDIDNESAVSGAAVTDALDNLNGAITDEAKTRGILGAKNFVKQEVLWANSENGITSTVNADGTLTISGTATNSYTFGLFQPPYIILPDGEYIASVGQNLTIRCLGFNGSSWVELAEGLGEQTFAATDSYTHYQFQVRFVTGTPYSGKLYPMIRLSTDIDNTFQKYAPTNAELNGAISDISTTTNTLFTLDGLQIGKGAAGATAATRAISADIYCENGIVVKAEQLPLNLKYEIEYYSSSNISDFVGAVSTGWITDNNTYSSPSSVTQKHFRILFGSVDNNALTASDFNGLVLQVNNGSTLEITAKDKDARLIANEAKNTADCAENALENWGDALITLTWHYNTTAVPANDGVTVMPNNSSEKLSRWYFIGINNIVTGSKKLLIRGVTGYSGELNLVNISNTDIDFEGSMQVRFFDPLILQNFFA